MLWLTTATTTATRQQHFAIWTKDTLVDTIFICSITSCDILQCSGPLSAVTTHSVQWCLVRCCPWCTEPHWPLASSAVGPTLRTEDWGWPHRPAPPQPHLLTPPVAVSGNWGTKDEADQRLGLEAGAWLALCSTSRPLICLLWRLHGLACLSDQTCVSEMSALDYCPLSTSYDIKSKYCEAQGKDKGKGGQGKVFDLKVIYWLSFLNYW